jgi:hypothetical protein
MGCPAPSSFVSDFSCGAVSQRHYRQSPIGKHTTAPPHRVFVRVALRVCGALRDGGNQRGAEQAQTATITQGGTQPSRHFLTHLDERITSVWRQINPAEAESRIEKPARDIKSDGLSRGV